VIVLSEKTIILSLSLIPQGIHRICYGSFKGIAAGSEEGDKGSDYP